MSLNKKLVIIFFISFFDFCIAIQDLMKDMRNYTGKDNYIHSGDVYEHSIWVLRTVAGWIKNNEQPWTEGIDIKKYKKVLFLAAFFHDIGKCGDNVFDWCGKGCHPETGFQYLTGKKKYRSINLPVLNNLDFKKIGKEFGVIGRDMNLVAILVAMHYKFGDAMRKRISSKDYIIFLKSTADQLSYPMSQELIRMCILISAADVKGLGYLSVGEMRDPVPYVSGMFDGVRAYPEWIGNVVASHPAKIDGWVDWKYQEVGTAARAKILDYYVKHKNE